MKHADPIDVVDERWGATCDRCGSARATVYCACECGRVLCDECELAERRERAVRQGLRILEHRMNNAGLAVFVTLVLAGGLAGAAIAAALEALGALL